MKKFDIWSVLCIIFALGVLVFGGLTAKNVIKGGDGSVSREVVKNYGLQAGVELDALNKDINSIKNPVTKGVKFPEGILENMKTAYAINNDLVGWLSIPGTEIDTAILQASNNDYYLKYDFYKDYTNDMTGTNYGNLFLDMNCPSAEYKGDQSISRNMIIHGHTTGKSDNIPKQAFRSLYNYQGKDGISYFKKNPIIKYSTLYGEYTYKICAVFYSTTQPGADNGYFFNYIYPDMSQKNMEGYIKQVKERALYETGVSLEPTDKVITLSTCIYVYGGSVDTRLVVVGRLLHEGEDESIDTSLVKDNPDYRRPQVWYNNNGKVNPYKDSEKWQPSPKG